MTKRTQLANHIYAKICNTGLALLVIKRYKFAVSTFNLNKKRFDHCLGFKVRLIPLSVTIPTGLLFNLRGICDFVFGSNLNFSSK